MPAKKIVCLGGGSLYFPRAIPDLLLSVDLAGSEIVVYDIDVEKAGIMAAMGRRLAEEAGTGCTVRSASGLADAIDSADFALSSIGGSGAEITSSVYASHVHNADVRIPARYGIQQVVGDTCGPGGMMMALRSLAAYMPICREMEKRCPKAILINHSNPMGVLCRAMHKYTDLTMIGICHGVQGGIHHAAHLLGVSPEELECQWIGTNHYYWFTRVTCRGEDVYPELKRRVAERRDEDGHALCSHLSEIYGFHIVYPEDDHVIEFYPFAAQTRGGQFSMPYRLGEKAKAFGFDESMPAPSSEPPTPEVRESFFQQYRKLLDDVQLPEHQDSSITGEGIGALVTAIATGRRQVFITNVANQGSIPNLPPTAEVEVESVTDSQGVRPIHMGDAPLVLKGILEKRFVWQELVADAGVKGDRNLALQAMMLDEMAIWPEQSEAMLNELLEASRDLLPQFFRG